MAETTQERWAREAGEDPEEYICLECETVFVPEDDLACSSCDCDNESLIVIYRDYLEDRAVDEEDWESLADEDELLYP